MHNAWAICTRDRTDASVDHELSFGMRVVLTILIVAITMAVIVWDVIEKPF